MHMYSTFQITENGKWGLSLEKNLHLLFFPTFHFPICRIHLSNGKCTCTSLSRSPKMENKTYPSRKTYTFGFFRLSIFRFEESTYPTENAHVEHFFNSTRMEKTYPSFYSNFSFSDLPNSPIQRKLHMYSTFQITENGKWSLSLEKKLHPWFFSGFLFSNLTNPPIQQKMHMYSTFQFTENGKWGLSLEKNLHLLFFRLSIFRFS